MCVCVWSVDTRVYTQSSLSVFTMLGTAVLSSPHPPILALASRHNRYKQCPDSTILRTRVKSANTRTLPYPRSMTILKWRTITTFNRKLLEKQSIKNSFASYEVHSEYPDSTISKILTVLKSRMITTLNRKVLEKQKLQLLPMRYT